MLVAIRVQHDPLHVVVELGRQAAARQAHDAEQAQVGVERRLPVDALLEPLGGGGRGVVQDGKLQLEAARKLVVVVCHHDGLGCRRVHLQRVVLRLEVAQLVDEAADGGQVGQRVPLLVASANLLGMLLQLLADVGEVFVADRCVDRVVTAQTDLCRVLVPGHRLAKVDKPSVVAKHLVDKACVDQLRAERRDGVELPVNHNHRRETAAGVRWRRAVGLLEEAQQVQHNIAKLAQRHKVRNGAILGLQAQDGFGRPAQGRVVVVGQAVAQEERQVHCQQVVVDGGQIHLEGVNVRVAIDAFLLQDVFAQRVALWHKHNVPRGRHSAAGELGREVVSYCLCRLHSCPRQIHARLLRQRRTLRLQSKHGVHAELLEEGEAGHAVEHSHKGLVQHEIDFAARPCSTAHQGPQLLLQLLYQRRERRGHADQANSVCV
eukprot:m.139062 g.139062  ORF g.139062 m.139062 type:complete len:433 (-) comp16647_c0_seq2:132-1430(-)